VTLGLLLYALVARGPVPGRMPGVLMAFLVGTALYYGLGAAGLSPGFTWPEGLSAQPALPWPSLGFIEGLPRVLPYLPLVLPFGLLMVVGGINVTESARAAGDDYRTRDILLTEAVSTLVAGLCGGVAQTTPYIGQPAYKRMGARSGYTLLTGLFIGLGGMLGLVSGLVELLPLAVLAPIIVFVAMDISVQAFQATPPRHAPAVVLAFFPPIAYLLAIKLGNPGIVPPERFAELFGAAGHGLPELAVIVALGNGFIMTSMIWATVTIFMPCSAQNFSRSGTRAIVPSSFMISQMTPAGLRPASRARSTAASVCPARCRTPPGRARSGKTWPGITRSSGPVASSTATRQVWALSAAEMPVEMPSFASMVAVNAVPIREELCWTIAGISSRSRISPAIGRQMRPFPYVAMKLMSSAVTSSAAIVRSPSFSLSSSSQTMTILPALMSSMMSSIGLNGILDAPLELFLNHPRLQQPLHVLAYHVRLQVYAIPNT